MNIIAKNISHSAASLLRVGAVMLLALVLSCESLMAAGQSAKGGSSEPSVATTKGAADSLRNFRQPRVSGAVEPDSVGIGDRFLYSIDVEKDLVQSLFFPSFGGEGSEAYELIEDMPIDTLSREGRRLRLRKSYLLAAFQEGVHRVIPQVMFADKNVVDTLYSEDTLSLLVTTFVIDSTSHTIFDIKPQRNLPFRMGEITGYIKWGIIIILLLALALYIAKRVLEHYGKSFGDIFRPAPPVPPHVAAFAALEKLRGERLWQEGKHKLYYSTLTDIVRGYIASRYEVGAMEMTSDEIIEAMRGMELPQKSKMDLTEILRDADLVKFAKAIPEAEQNEAAYRAAWDFVEQTKPVEQSDEEDEESGGSAVSKSAKEGESGVKGKNLQKGV